MNIYRDKRSCNWFWVDNSFIKDWAKNFGPTTSAVYMALCMFASEENGSCYPSMTTLADMLGTSRQTILNSLKKLEESEVIDIEHGKGEGNPNIYTINPLSNCQGGVKYLNRGCQNSLQGVSNSFTGGVKQLDSNNTNITIPINNITTHPSFKHQNTTTEVPPAPTFDFESAYKQYPRHEGKAKAAKHFKAQIKSQDQYDQLLKAISNYAKHITNNKTEPQFIMMASTFFNTRWLEWVSKEPVQPKPTPKRYIEL